MKELILYNVLSFLGRIHVRNMQAAYVGGLRSASSPNSPIVRTTRSTFSRNAFAVRRASRIVAVVKVLAFWQAMSEHTRTTVHYSITHATRKLSSVVSSRFTACGCSSLSTSITCLAISACFWEAKGTRMVLAVKSSLIIGNVYCKVGLTCYASVRRGWT